MGNTHERKVWCRAVSLHHIFVDGTDNFFGIVERYHCISEALCSILKITMEKGREHEVDKISD